MSVLQTKINTTTTLVEYVETVGLYKNMLIIKNCSKNIYFVYNKYYWYNNSKTYKIENILFTSSTLRGIKNKITRFVKKV